jgi:transcriptional regulator with XRE-family HTH domain
MTLGIEIAQARRRKSLTQRDLSEQCGLTSTSISEIERGRVYPREPKALLAIARVLGISAEELLKRIQNERGAKPNAWNAA